MVGRKLRGCLASEAVVRRVVAAQALEGSRFGAYPATLATFVSSLVPPKRTKTGRSPERPIGWQLYDLGINESKALGECIALGNPREPPVATLFWPDGALRRISRGRPIRAKAAPLQALGNNAPQELATVSRTSTIRELIPTGI